MLHVLTGANGTGKTCFGLKWVRDCQVKENRPVCYNGRFDIVPDGELKNWKKIDIKNWQDEPDGTIFFVDECHNDFPTRPNGSTVPDYVKMLAEHRKRGFDFYLLTQHPGNMDAFVRKLVGAPGWHRHLKRVAGGSPLVSVLQWDSVHPSPERDGSGRSAEVSTSRLPKEVYGWYTSAVMHTGKVRIPKVVYWFLGALIVAAGSSYYAVQSLKPKQSEHAQVAAAATGADAGSMSAAAAAATRGPLTVGEWVAQRQPRLPDFPHTAPAYDGVVAPVAAPYPAACVFAHERKTCLCYSQQGTVLRTSGDVCMQIVKNGFFVDWQAPTSQPAAVGPRSQVHVESGASPASVAPSVRPVARADLPPSSWSQGLAARNAEVRSSIGGR